MPKPSSPLRPAVVSIVVGGLQIAVPVSAIAVLVVAMTPGLAQMLTAAPQLGPSPMPVPPQNWTAGSDALPALAMAVTGSLPPPDPRQRRKPCKPRLEEEIDGVCWIALRASPPCPEQSWEYKGACYGMALPAARLPSSGEPRRANVADP